jgi:hypothetical protein
LEGDEVTGRRRSDWQVAKCREGDESLRRRRTIEFVIPAKAGTQPSPWRLLRADIKSNGRRWTPACAGATK